MLDGAAASRRFPGYHLPASFRAMHEPEGGFLVPERCIEAHLRQAQQQGAELVAGARVQRWQVLPGGGAGGGDQGLVQVDTAAESFTARRLVLAGGGWMPMLVPELKVRVGGCWELGWRGGTGSLHCLPRTRPPPPARLCTTLPPQPLLTVERQVVGWFDVAPEYRAAFAPDAFPVNLLQDESGYYYCFPADEHGFKIGKYNHRRDERGGGKQRGPEWGGF